MRQDDRDIAKGDADEAHDLMTTPDHGGTHHAANLKDA
jgi:hypothetical protein